MQITSFFQHELCAPLANPRWSWGSVHPDGHVFLRVWGDQVEVIGGIKWVRLTDEQKAAAYKDSHGHNKLAFEERKKQIGLVHAGAKCWMVMGWAKNKDAMPREIKDFDKDRVFPVLKLEKRSDDFWAGWERAVSLDELKRILRNGNSRQH